MSYLAQSGWDGAFAAILLLSAALGIGGLLRRKAEPTAQNLLEAFALGLAALGLLAFSFHALGLMSLSLLALPALAAIAGLWFMWRMRSAWATLLPRDGFEKLVVAVVVLLLGTGFLAALGPELEPDALSYHLPAAASFAQSVGSTFDPHNYPTGYPLLAEAGYGWLALMRRPEGARVLHMLVTALAVVATALLARRTAGRRAGALAAAILAGVPLVVWTGQTANTDGYGMLFFVLAVLRLDEHFRSGKRGDLLLSALFVGSCASVKIWNLLFVPLLAAAVIAFWLRLARQGKAKTRQALAQAGLFFAIAVGAYFPWMVRAAALAGNPMYPLLAALFKPDQVEFFRFISASVNANYGTGHGFVDLLLIGWNLTFMPERFGHLAIGWLLLPLVTFGLVRLKHWPLLRLLTPLAGVAFLLWFATSQQIRYLAPLFPFAAALAAAPVALIAEQKRWRFLPWLVVVMALSGWTPAVAHQWPEAGFVPRVHFSLLTGKQTRDQIRERFAYNDEWSLWRFANHALDVGARVAGDGAQARWWAQREFADVGYDPDLFRQMRGGLLSDGTDSLYLITAPAREERDKSLFAEGACRVYHNGLLTVLQPVTSARPCSNPAMAQQEPYRWLEVAGPRDAGGYYWIGEQALLILPGRRDRATLELVAPFAEQGVTKLEVTVSEREPFMLTIRERFMLDIRLNKDELVRFRALGTADPIALGYGGDPTPKSFLVKIVDEQPY